MSYDGENSYMSYDDWCKWYDLKVDPIMVWLFV
jgi:hypothetical protein